MIEGWFAIAIMLGVHSDGTKDVYIFQQPKEHGHFHSAMECRDFVRNNPVPIIKTLVERYSGRPVEKLLCVHEKKVKKFLVEQNLKELDT